MSASLPIIRRFRAIVPAMFAVSGLISLSATARGDDGAQAEVEHPVAPIAERVNAARARIESASYRVVLNQEFMPEYRERIDVDVTNNQITTEVLTKDDMRRVRRHMVVRHEGEQPDTEGISEAVINSKGIGVWRGGMRPIQIYEHERIDRASFRNRERFEAVAGRDPLLYAFGDGHFALDRGRQYLPNPDQWSVREVNRDGRPVIEVRTYMDEQRETLLGVLIVDPQRGDLVTSVTGYHPEDGQVTGRQEIEPTLIEDHDGELVWFPETVRNEVWRRNDHDGLPYLGSHRIFRFEEVQLNHPIEDEQFSFVNALSMREARTIMRFGLDGRGEHLLYEEGELIPTGNPVLRRTADGQVTDGPID